MSDKLLPRCPMNVSVKRIGAHALELPSYAHQGDAGMDLRACGEYDIAPGARVLIGCGFAFEIPLGFEGQVRPRSGLTKRGVVAAFGTIDSGYRGEVMVSLWNTGAEPFAVCHGDRIAQLVVAPFATCKLVEEAELSDTPRGEGGFGSTGVR